MQYYTQEELEQTDSITIDDVKHCFSYLNKLIIHCQGDEARDYCNALGLLIGQTMKKTTEVKPVPFRAMVSVDALIEGGADYEFASELIGDEPVVTVTKLETVSNDQFKVETYFAWSAYPETCYFCKKHIPARKTGCGIFADNRMKHKWCEDCATETHKKHPNYLKYKK